MIKLHKHLARNRLLLRQLDQRLAPWRSLPKNTPRGGWLRVIRQALGMSAPQLARRLGVTRQGLADIERRESDGTITLSTLSQAANALGCDLVYAIVPRTDLQNVVESRARERAWEEVNKAAHMMHLEAQDVSQKETNQLVEERTAQLLSANPRKLWAALRTEEDSEADISTRRRSGNARR
jgi:predicted DNA-binding mobile mystery protein A